MEIHEVGPGVMACLRGEEGANVGLVHTAAGVVVVDTASSPADMRRLLAAGGVRAEQVVWVVNTHWHSDHTWGNQLFGCPILAHWMCREAMQANLESAWDVGRIRTAIAEREQAEPDWADEMSRRIVGLQVTLPTEIFEERHSLEVGDVRIEVLHVDGHTPGSAVVWLADAGVLFAGDLIFEGCYPYLGEADITELIRALKGLSRFGARVVVPGHGSLCGDAEIAALLAYLEGTWGRTIDHLAQGHSEDEAAADSGYPRYAERWAERMHEANIRIMYRQLGGGEFCPL